MRRMAVELFDCPGAAHSPGPMDQDLVAPEDLAADAAPELDAYLVANSGIDQAESATITINQRA